MATKEDAECYIFVDHSNLWIAGQTVQAKNLVDADSDSRYRVDLGKFLHVLAKDRHISKAFLYGSVPPPNDSVWKAARKKNFEVKVFERSGSGREKEVDVAMTTDILDNLYKQIYTETKENAIFITVTGDRDLKIPVEKALNNGVPVELWSWEHSMAREFRKLANTHHLFTASTLDSVQESFSFTAIKSTHAPTDVNPAHAIVYKDVPGGKQFLYILADHVSRLMRLFYISSIEKENTQDLIVQFPNSTQEVVLRKLRELEFEYRPCSYPEYLQSRKTQQGQQGFIIKLKLTNRFKALTGIDTDDFESVLEAVESSMSSKLEDISIGSVSTGGVSALEEDATGDFDDWATELRRKVGRMTRNRRRKEIKCTWGDHCAVALDCPYKHTEDEKKLFARLPNFRFKYLKTRECNKKEQHATEEQRKWCGFAHSNKDSWCLACRIYGHLTDNCRVKK